MAKILLTVQIDVGSKTKCLAVDKPTLILISIRVKNIADSVRNSITPVAFINTTVGPALFPMAVLHFFALNKLELSVVNTVVVKFFIHTMDYLAVIDWLDTYHRREVNLDWVRLEFFKQVIT